MKLRRDFLLGSLLLAISVLGPGSAPAQQRSSKPARIIWISVLPLAQVESYLDAFRSGLAAEGYVEGRDVEVLARSADGNRERLPAVVDEIVECRRCVHEPVTDKTAPSSSNRSGYGPAEAV